MPIDIGGTPAPHFGNLFSGYGALSSIMTHSYNPDSYWKTIGPKRRGSLTGGLTQQHLYDLTYDPMKYTIVSPSRDVDDLDSPILGTRNGLKPRTGAFTLDMIDWNANLDQLSGTTLGRSQPLIGRESLSAELGDASGLPEIFRDPLGYMEQRDIDPFTNGPARLYDYAFALADVVLNGIGIRPSGPGESEPHRYPFQKDPGYWQWLRDSTPEQRRQRAEFMADRSIDHSRNKYLRDQLQQAFDRDYDSFNGFSSGNVRTDLVAKRMFDMDTRINATMRTDARSPIEREIDLMHARYRAQTPTELLTDPATYLPFIGTQVSAATRPIGDDLERRWRALSQEQRNHYFTESGAPILSGEIIGTLPLFAGTAVVAGIARVGGFGSIASKMGASTKVAELAGKAGVWGAKGYDATLRASNIVMAMGLTTATASWAMQSFAPNDSVFARAGRRIDASRIVSESSLAGIVNATGFLSGFYGVETAVPGWWRIGGKVAGKTGLHRGLPDLAFHREVGGSGLHKVLRDKYDISDQLQGTALTSEFLSYSHHNVRRVHDAEYAAVQRGQKIGITEIDALPELEQRLEAVEALIANEARHTAGTLSLILPKIMNVRKVDRDLAMGWEGRKVAHAQERIWMFADNEATQAMLGKYGPRFWGSRLGENRSTAQQLLRGLNKSDDLADLDAWAGSDIAKWHQVNRKLHQMLFHQRNAELLDAAQGTLEDGKLFIASQRNTFADQIDDDIAQLTSPDYEAGQRYMDQLIKTRDDIQDLHANGAFATPEDLAAVLDKMREVAPARRTIGPDAADGMLNDFNRTLDEEGLWAIAYKPQAALPDDLEAIAQGIAQGTDDFVSYVTLPGGNIYRTPFLDYPMTSSELIDMGNRSVAAAKFDDVFRGWRSWRLEESQRTALHRRLTDLDVGLTPAQIDRLHYAMQDLASEFGVPPQAATLAPNQLPFVKANSARVDETIRQIVGEGPWLKASGVVADIDWRHELALAYQVSFKLNATAGLTSWMYSHLGAFGSGASFISHVVYPAFRFSLSPIFKAGEIAESWVLNAMRGVNPFHGDPFTEGIAMAAGVTHARGQIRAELATDPIFTGLTNARLYEEAAPETKSTMFRTPVMPNAGNIAAARTLQRQRMIDDALADQMPDYSLAETYPDQYSDAAQVAMAHGADETGAPILEVDGRGVDDRAVAANRAAWLEEERARYDPADPEGSIHPFLAGVAFVEDLGPDYVPRLTQALAPVVPLDLDAVLSGASPIPAEAIAIFGDGLPGVRAALKPSAWTQGVIRSGDDIITGQGAYRVLAGQVNRMLHGAGSGRTGSTGDLGALHFDSDVTVDLPTGASWRDIEAVFLQPGDVQRWVDLVQTYGDELPELRQIRIVPETPDVPGMYRFEKAGLLDRRYADVTRHSTTYTGAYNRYLPDDLIDQRTASRIRSEPVPKTGTFLEDLSERHAVLDDLMPASFRVELQQAAAAKAGVDETTQPIVHAYLRGKRGAFTRREDAEVVISVIGPDGQPFGGLDFGEIGEAWRRTAIPMTTTARLTMGGSWQTVLETQGHRLMWTPEGGPHGSLIAYDKKLPENGQHFVQGDGTLAYRDPDLPPERLMPITFEYSARARPDDDMIVDLLTSDAHGRLDMGTAEGPLDWTDHGRYRSVTLPRVTDAAQARAMVDRLLMMHPGKPARVSVAPDNPFLMRELASRRARGQLPDGMVFVAPGSAKFRTALSERVVAAQPRPAPRVPAIGTADDWAVPIGAASPIDGEWRFIAKESGVKPELAGQVEKVNRTLPGDVIPQVRYVARDAKGYPMGVFDFSEPQPGKIGTIQLVNVRPDARRRGVATALYDQAIADGYDVLSLSGKGTVTALGKEFAAGYRAGLTPQRTVPYRHPKAEMVPTDYLLQFRELDREKVPKHPSWAGYLDELTEMIRQNGITEEAILYWDPKTNRVLLADGNHRLAVAQRLGIDEMPVRVARASLKGVKKSRKLTGEPMVKADEHGYVPADLTPSQVLGHDFAQTRGTAFTDRSWQEVWGVPPEFRSMMPEAPPTSLEDVPGGPEHFTATFREQLKRTGGKAWEAFKNPVPGKQVQQDKLIFDTVNEWFPVELADLLPDTYRLMHDELGIPDDKLLTWLVEDRRLLDRWYASNAREDFDALVMHAEQYRPGNGRAELDALYEGDEWTSMMEVLRLTGRAASDEAFQVHFFSPYRSTFERTINHPVFGVYPASWAYKVAKEWYRFLFDNDMLSGFHLGMTPAVWIAQMREQQQVAFAQMSDVDLDTWYREGPLSSSIFIWNLLMPGDWSALPFPLSRSLRDAVRGNFDPYTHFQNNMWQMGAGRDVRLFTELKDEWITLLKGEHDELRRGETLQEALPR